MRNKSTAEYNAGLAIFTLAGAVILAGFTGYALVSGSIPRHSSTITLASLALGGYSILALFIGLIASIVRKVGGLKVAPLGAKIYLIGLVVAIICLVAVGIANPQAAIPARP
jgi:hypothetical protein